MKKVFIIFIVTFFFIQCDNHYEYSSMNNLNNSWNKHDTLSFNFEIKNAKNTRNLNFVVRNNDDYPFNNLYLFVKLKHEKKIISADTLNYKLADQTGKWMGSGMGSVKEIYFQYKKDFSFPEDGFYTLSVVQGMRKDTLKGIEDFGVNIE